MVERSDGTGILLKDGRIKTETNCSRVRCVPTQFGQDMERIVVGKNNYKNAKGHTSIPTSDFASAHNEKS